MPKQTIFDQYIYWTGFCYLIKKELQIGFFSNNLKKKQKFLSYLVKV